MQSVVLSQLFTYNSIEFLFPKNETVWLPAAGWTSLKLSKQSRSDAVSVYVTYKSSIHDPHLDAMNPFCFRHSRLEIQITRRLKLYASIDTFGWVRCLKSANVVHERQKTSLRFGSVAFSSTHICSIIGFA
jgi:hypothetical protein